MSAQGQTKTYFAQSWADPNIKIGVSEAERSLHFLAIGASGTGKSTLLLSKIRQDLRNGRGLAVIDPHGDLAEAALAEVPPHRLKHVAYINAVDFDYPVGLNPLERVGRDEATRYLMVANLMNTFQKFWADSWGPRMAHVLRNCLLTLVANPGSTLLGVNKLLTSPDYRESLLQNVTDRMVLDFWRNEYAAYNDRFRVEVISPVQNKLGALLSNRVLRNILCQSKSTIRFTELIKQRRILIVNLAKGLIGEEAANLLGSLILSKLIITGLGRASIPEVERHNYYIYADEYHNFVASSQMLSTAMSESRKYGLCLIMAHQYLNQVDWNMREAVLANVGTLAVFQVDSEDAERLGKKFGAHWPWENLVGLKRFEMYCRPSRASSFDQPINGSTLPPRQPSPDAATRVRDIRRLSRQRYGRPRARVERAIEHLFALKKWPRYEDKTRPRRRKGVKV